MSFYDPLINDQQPGYILVHRWSNRGDNTGSYGNEGSTTRRLRAFPCHPEGNEGTEPSQPGHGSARCFVLPALSEVEWAQHDNSVEGVSQVVFLASSDDQRTPS